MRTVVRGGCAHDCPDTCAWEVGVERGRAVDLRGAREHPYTNGALCAKVNHYLDRVYDPARLLHPLRRAGPKGEGTFERVSWDEALRDIADRLAAVVERWGGEAVLPYSYAGNMGIVQGGSLDRRFFARLGASRLARTICGETANAGVRQVLGTSAGRLPEDVEDARLIVLWGTNTLVTNLHLWPYVRRARARGARLVVIDPLRTRTAAEADWHVQPLPGTDAALALGLMHVIVASDLHDQDYLDRHCEGWEELRARLDEYPPDQVAELCGLEPDVVVRLARAYATERPAMLRTLVGPEKHPGGGTAFRAIACLPAVTGAWRERGGGLLHWTSALFSEGVGGRELRGRSARARTINMVQIGRALTDGALDPPVQALFVYDANPASIAPNSSLVRRGLARDDLFCVVHELFLTDTARYADYVLPATSFIEHLDLLGSWGHAYLTLNRPAIAPRGEALPNTELFRRLAVAMGWGSDPALAASDEELVRQALATGHPYLRGITLERLEAEGWAPLSLEDRGVAFTEGGFPTSSGRCRLAQPELAAQGLDPVPSFAPPASDPRYPLVLVSSKQALHFLNSSYSMLPRHAGRESGPNVELDPVDAAARGIADGDRVQVCSEVGRVELLARVAGAVRPGVVAIPHGHWRSLGGAAANDLTSDGLADLGGGGDFYGTRVEVAPA
ncbi:MAG: molybdopterin-dependent oxidoreductase [Candidatus Dormibacteraeota bacterium]|nr:molybdopterin-dependent oxidoreductase [Candidatus Dormibacteraeota bacterium]MBO0762062.1 molybdopterin-dependent oxidoreductase [Candidatus Dormibacteraeota bacterium]